MVRAGSRGGCRTPALNRVGQWAAREEPMVDRRRATWRHAVLALAVAGVLASPVVIAYDDAADERDRQARAQALDAAHASADRPPADREQDARRKSREVLALLGVGPGMRVIDVFAAGGYNTELLARTVGVTGQVVAYNNPAYFRFAGDAIAKRYADGRLGNVRQVTAEVDELQFPPATFDAALIVMAYHDAYWRPADGGFDRTDPRQLLDKLYAALKPGGVVVVQDHVAAPGGDPTQVAGALHRIDPALVRRDFERAGFEFDGQSDALAQPGDDHARPVFDDAVRGRTDQFVHRYVKPALPTARTGDDAATAAALP
jgi:predicted methyltransferase